jgi:hypothetical protein
MHLGSGAHSVDQSLASVISPEVTPLHKSVLVAQELFERLCTPELVFGSLMN